jgi:hypothetical protein
MVTLAPAAASDPLWFTRLPTATFPKLKLLAFTVSFGVDVGFELVEFELTGAVPPPHEKAPAIARAITPKRQGLPLGIREATIRIIWQTSEVI